MVDNPVWEICECVAEVQALLDDHIAGGKHSAADVAKVQAVLSEAELLRAMFDVGYFRPNTPPIGAARLTGLDLRNHGSQNTFEALISTSVRDKPISRNSSSLRLINSWHKCM